MSAMYGVRVVRRAWNALYRRIQPLDAAGKAQLQRVRLQTLQLSRGGAVFLPELTATFRQSDPAFVAALNEIRLGRCSEPTKALLRGCLGRTLPEDDGVSATRLCSHVKDCERINAACLAQLPGEELVFRARDTARDDASLAQLVDETLGLPLDKAMRLSNWKRRPLTPPPLEYAALDAHCLVRLYAAFRLDGEGPSEGRTTSER